MWLDKQEPYAQVTYGSKGLATQLVEVPGRDFGIPILFLLRILSRESKTRTVNSTSTDYQKKATVVLVHGTSKSELSQWRLHDD